MVIIHLDNKILINSPVRMWGLSWSTVQRERSSTYASERSIFSLTGIADSGDGSWIPSVSGGWDSCFAAACKTRLWTSEDEGDVGSPMRFVSNFPAAHENAWAPNLTGASSSLQGTGEDLRVRWFFTNKHTERRHVSFLRAPILLFNFLLTFLKGIPL